MAFVGVNPRTSVAQLYCLIKQSERSELKESFNEIVLIRMELLPDIFEWYFIDIPNNNTAACAAKDITKRINVHAFGPEEIRLTIISILGDSLKRSLGMVS